MRPHYYKGMGRVWSFFILVIVVGVIGCNDPARRDLPVPMTQSQSTSEEKPQIKYIKRACPNEAEVFDLKEKCFKNMSDRDALIDELRAQIESLRSELRYANESADEWRKRYNEYTCD